MQITAIDYRTLRWPIAPRGAARGRSTERTAAILAVRTDSGATGLGEAAPLPGMSIDHVDDAIRAFEALTARLPLAIDVPAHATAIADRVTPAPAARFAIETALLAALAQHTRTSIAALLAPVPHAELRNAVVVDDEADALVAAALGAPCLKIKAPSPADLDRVRRIARAVPGMRLRIDANRGWPRAQVRALLASLADLPIDYVEEPCVDAHELLARHQPVRIALDESLVDLTRAQLGHALESAQLAALVLKPTLLGGFARCLELAAAAHAHGIAPVVTHTLEGPIGFAACRELARAIGADVAAGLARHPALVRFSAATRCPPPDTGRDPDCSDVVGLRGEPVSATTLPAHHHDGYASGDWTAVVAYGRAWTFEECMARAPLPAIAVVATPTIETIGAIYRALAERQPLALLHAKATAEELARQRALVADAELCDRDAIVLFTSGSTGPSRGVVLSRDALFAAAAASAEHLGWRHDDRWLCCLPLAHAGGLSIVVRCLAARRPVVLGELGAIDDGVTLASLVPAQLAQLLDDPTWRPSPRLRAVLLGGAAAPPALIAAAVACGVPVLPTYGLTETFGQVATARVPGGRPVPLSGVTIDAGTREAPSRIRLRGAMLASRYLDGAPIAPELTTADLGFVDEHGELHVLGRADDVIISGGENVHPTQVEAVLAATPGVRAAAAFGVADVRWGQVVGAAISVGGSFDQPQALAQWHAQLPPHARPRWLAVVDELPRLPSGKLDRRRVAALPAVAVDYAQRLAVDHAQWLAVDHAQRPSSSEPAAELVATPAGGRDDAGGAGTGRSRVL